MNDFLESARNFDSNF